jgi:hypothetical protein
MPVAFVALSFLSAWNPVRFTVVEFLGHPLRPLLSSFPGLFYRDIPFYNLYGSLVITSFYALLGIVVWSIVSGRNRSSHDS